MKPNLYDFMLDCGIDPNCPVYMVIYSSTDVQPNGGMQPLGALEGVLLKTISESERARHNTEPSQAYLFAESGDYDCLIGFPSDEITVTQVDDRGVVLHLEQQQVHVGQGDTLMTQIQALTHRESRTLR